jgi:hypothetical protein
MEPLPESYFLMVENCYNPFNGSNIIEQKYIFRYAAKRNPDAVVMNVWQLILAING